MDKEDYLNEIVQDAWHDLQEDEIKQLLIDILGYRSVEDLVKHKALLDDLNNNYSNFSKAIIEAQNLINKRVDLDTASIKEQSQAFLERAKEHKSSKENKLGDTKSWKSIYWLLPDKWLFSAFIFALLFVGLSAYFLFFNADQVVTTGQAILRISLFLIPAYFTVFSINQYLYHKKMHEAYMFRHSSLLTMNNLLETHADEKLREKILSKGLDVLFTEPSIKDDQGKYDKQLITELIGMLKSQMK